MNKINLKKIEDFHISHFHSHNNTITTKPTTNLSNTSAIISPKKMIVVTI